MTRCMANDPVKACIVAFIGCLFSAFAHADMPDRLANESAQKKAVAVETEKQGRLRHQEMMRDYWRKLYQPSEVCRRDPSSMPCVNAHASAYKRFMEIYGEMPPRF